MSLISGTGVNSRRLILPLAIAAAAVLAYSNSFSGAFLLDDYRNIAHNPDIGRFWPQVLNSTRPIVGLSFFLNCRLGGVKAADFHLVNLAIHIIAGLALFVVVRRTLQLLGLAQRYGGSAAGLAALVAAAWLVHPIQTAAVTYIVQRAESLMGMFYFVTLYCNARSFRSGKPHRWHTATIVFCALGMATKPAMATAPVMVLLYDRMFLSRPFGDLLRRRGHVYLGLSATWLVLVALLSVPNESSTSAGYGAGLLSPFGYLLTQCVVVFHYLKLVFLPGGLCLDYAWPAASAGEAVLPGLVLLLLLGASIWLYSRGNGLGWAGLWFFITLAPSSSIIPVADYAFDHRMYVPLAGIVAAMVFGTHALLKDRIRRPLLVGLACTTVAMLAVLTWLRNCDYQTEEAMWRDVVDKCPDNLRARNDLAVALSEAGKVEEALAEYGEVLARIPDEEKERFRQGDVDLSAMIPANSHRQNYFRAHANLGLMKQLLLGDTEAATMHYRAALRVNPGHAGVRAKLAAIGGGE